MIRIRDLSTHQPVTFYDGAYSSEYIVRKGDVLIGMDGEFNIVKWEGPDALLNQRVLKLVADGSSDIVHEYAYYLLKPILKEIEYKTSATTVKHLSLKDFDRIEVDLPAREDQKRIAEILSTADEQIQTTEAMIAKHEMIKEGMLQDLFTRGIDVKTGELRPSYEEAPEFYKETELGMVPREWEVKRIKDFSKVRRGASPRPISDPKYFGDGAGWVRIVDVTRSQKYLLETEQYLSPLGESKSVRVYPGNLIMSICATVGKPVILDMDACIHDGFVLFEFHDTQILKDYFWLSLKQLEPYFNKQGQPGTQINLNTTIVGMTLLSLPAIEEQECISEVFEGIQAEIQILHKEKVKLERLKKGLMNDLLSGLTTATTTNSKMMVS